MITFDRRTSRGSSAARAAAAILVTCLLGISMSCKESASTTAPPGNSSGSGDYLGAGTPGTPVSDAERFAAFDTVRQHLAFLRGLDIPAANAQMAAYFRTMMVFDAAGVSGDGSVWAHFTDDRLLIVANNRPPGESGPEAFEKHVAATTPNSPEDLPSQKKARLLNAMGSYYPDVTPRIKSIITANGYSISSEDAGVDALRNTVSGDGIFYFSTHGGNGDLMHMVGGKLEINGELMSLMTSTPVSTTLDNKYITMLEDHQLTYFAADNDTDASGAVTSTVHYGITPFFVTDHMNFGENCIVYMDACSSYKNDFFEACRGNNASVYIGWDKPVVSSDANSTAMKIFDELLGANKIGELQHPPQRPFSVDLVFDKLSPRTFLGPKTKEGNREGTTIFYNRLNPNFTILAPSIEHVEIDESVPTITLYGSFGPDPGVNDREITVQGVPLSNVRWDSSMIICDIRKSGDGSAGDVAVVSRGHVSNVVQLTEWRGTITYNQPSVGLLGEFYSFDLHFRGDVHSFRKKPHETPQPLLEADIGLMEDSKGTFRIGGIAGRDCPPANNCVIKNTEIWTTKQLNLNYLGNNVGTGSGFYGLVALNPQVKKVSLILLGGVGDELTSSFTFTTVCDGISETNEIDDTFGSNTVVPPLAYIPMDMDDAYVIKSGHMDINHPPRGRIPGACVDSPPDVVYTISWSDFSPIHAPATDAAR